MSTALANGNGTAVRIGDDDIFDAIDLGFRTLGGLKRRLELPREYDLASRLAFMVEDKKLRKLDNGNITAFFLYEQMPTKFWLDGNGRVEAEFDRNFTPRDDQAKAEELLGGRAEFNKTLPSKPEEKASSGHSRKKVEIDPQALMKASSENKSKQLIAKALGISAVTLDKKLNGDNKLMKAYLDGVKLRHVNAKTAEPSTEPKKRGVAKGERRGPYLRGRKYEPEVQTPGIFKKATEKVAKNLVDQVEKSLRGIAKGGDDAAKTFTVHKEGVVAKYLNLDRGGQILVAFEGDLFTMTAGEMELLGRLNEVLQQYEEA